MAVRFLATPAIRRDPKASTRACSTASNTPRACGLPGISLRCTFGSWQASFSAIESAWPRTMAASRRVILRAGSGSRALPGDSPGRSAAKLTSSSGLFAIALRQADTARLNGSVGASLDPVRNLVLVVIRSPYNAIPLQRLGQPVARDAAWIAVDGAERLIAAGAIERRRLDAHGVDI